MFQDLARLFQNPRRAKLLKFYIFQNESRYTAAMAGKAVGIPKRVAEKEVRALMRLGALASRKQKKATYFSINRNYPSLTALYTFFDATTLPNDRAILEAFRGVSGITLLVATGALTRQERGAIDLLIVARKSKNPRIAKAVYKLESMAGMPLRFTVLEASDYAERLEAHDRLLRDVFEFENRTIIGHSEKI